MATITGDNALEWKMREMARRAGKKFEPESTNPFAGLDKAKLKEQKAFIKEALKEAKSEKAQ
jgi:hypothetical protein